MPASGRFTTVRALSVRQRISGELATRMLPRACRYIMYGLGFTTRSARYTSKGSAYVERANRCDSTN